MGYLKREHIDLKTKPGTKLKELRGLVVHWTSGLNNGCTADNWASSWEQQKGVGAHFAIDQNKLVQYVNEDEVVYHGGGGTPSYIVNTLFDGKINDYTVGLEICVCDNQDYPTIEARAIRFIAEFLTDHKMTTDSVFRHYDSTGKPCPLQYLEKDKWYKFLDEIKKYMEAMQKSDFDPDKYKVDNIYKTQDDFRKFMKERHAYEAQTNDYWDNQLWEWGKAQGGPDSRGIKSITAGKATVSASDAAIRDADTPFKNKLFLQEAQMPSGVDCECNKPENFTNGKLSSKPLCVEPIYPDTSVPPTQSTGFFNSGDKKDKTYMDTLMPGIDEYQSRQKVFDPKKYSHEVKKDKGKIVNNNDPYPVDTKVEQLEKHHPKVKIDTWEYKCKDCNHAACSLGQAVKTDVTQIIDVVAELSQRTEKRLCALENITSTLLRNVWRMSSRMHINCVYYGGQDAFGKYNCIRCLNTDRIADGQSVTLDQCLSCSRYEPIIGQVYDIIGESGQNLAQVLDDNQMAYMNMNDYIDLCKTEQMHDKKPIANFKDTIDMNGIIEKKLKEVTEEVDKAIKEKSDKAKQEADKKAAEEKKKDEVTVKTTEITDASKAENKKADELTAKQEDKSIVTKVFSCTEATYDDNDGHPSKHISDVEIKIEREKLLNIKLKAIDPNLPVRFIDTWDKGFVMDYKMQTWELQQPNINPYNYNRANEQNADAFKDDSQHKDDFKDTRKDATSAERFDIGADGYDGIFPDETSLDAIGSIAGSDLRNKIIAKAKELCDDPNTGYSQESRGQTVNGIYYTDCSLFTRTCYAAAGIDLHDITNPQWAQCQPKAGGKIVEEKDALPGDIVFWFTGSDCHHVAIYGGKHDKYAANGREGKALPDQVSYGPLYGEPKFGRPAELVKADEQAASNGNFSVAAQKVPQVALAKYSAIMKGRVQETIANMKKYGYKNDILTISKKYGFDPYYILAVCCGESNGTPGLSGTPGDEGMMQASPTSGQSAAKDIEDGCKHLLMKMNNPTYNPTKNYIIALYNYNGGACWYNTMKKYGGPPLTDSTVIGDIYDAMKKCYVNEYSSYMKDKDGIPVHADYPARICIAYDELKRLNALG